MDSRLKIFILTEIAIIFVLFIFQSIKAVENSPLFFSLFVTEIGLGVEGTFALLLCL